MENLNGIWDKIKNYSIIVKDKSRKVAWVGSTGFIFLVLPIWFGMNM